MICQNGNCLCLEKEGCSRKAGEQEQTNVRVVVVSSKLGCIFVSMLGEYGGFYMFVGEVGCLPEEQEKLTVAVLVVAARWVVCA